MSWKEKKFIKAHVLRDNRNDPEKIVLYHNVGGYQTLYRINGSRKLERKDYIYFEHNNNPIKHLLNKSKYFVSFNIQKSYSDMLSKVRLILKHQV